MAVDIDGVAATVLAALDDRSQIAPFTASGGLEVSEAYRVTERLRHLRMERGDRPVGRKIGFTNRGIWAEYGVYAPIWGDVYDRTLHAIEPGARIVVSHLCEPRIEPEIVLGLSHDLSPGMSLGDIAHAIGWVAHGFEIVQSIYPDWRFQAADCIANGGLHGLLAVGPRRKVADGEHEGLAAALSGLDVTLHRAGESIDAGSGANALDGPIEALAHLVDVLGRDPVNPSLRAGELVTTGTLTRAFPVLPGQHWATTIRNYPLGGLTVELA